MREPSDKRSKRSSGSARVPRPFLSVQQAAFRLGERLVFENTSWIFQDTEHWAVVGANGSGKSLFADALRGRLPLVRGELRYHFRPPRGLSPEEAIGHASFEERKAVLHGAVVQSRWNSLEEAGALRVGEFLSYEQVMEINPFEVVEHPRAGRLRFARRRRVAVSLLGIAPFLERTLMSLSNGEMQRVQLARALCHPLRLLILDEPFIGLDAAARDHFRGVLERLMAASLRVLLLTTRPEDLPRHVTHVLWLDRCRIAGAGPRRLLLSSFKAQGRKFIAPPIRTPARPRSSPPVRSLVRLRNVTVRYGSRTILRSVTWNLREGESWALLGPNGSGKTTLLSLLMGDNPQAYANQVEVFGRARGHGQSIWELKRRIGWVSAELHLHFEAAATCFEVVASGFNDSIGLFEPPTRLQRAAVRTWLERFDLRECGGVPLFGLSAGLQRMVLLARALVKEPELLILDEPCQGLDAAHRAQIVQTVDRLIRANATTVLYVTHRADEIPGSIRRVLKLAAGRAARVSRRVSR